MTSTETKPRAPKAIAVSKLIGGKLVTTLAKSELKKLETARDLCADIGEIDAWRNESSAAFDALQTLIVKVQS
jgi:hypothetical protein